MTQAFNPTVYLLVGCPFCLKFLIFVSEAGLIADMTIVRADPKGSEFQVLQARISDSLKSKATFPAVEIEPDIYKVDSDSLIQYFAQKHDICVDNLPALSMYKEGVLPAFINLHKENSVLKQAADR
jgi:hypothetical protein